MSFHRPYQVIGFHSCDREVGIPILNGDGDLRLSKNEWDWLGPGIYFWEHNPGRALEYAIDSSLSKQFNKVRIKTPYVLGAIIEPGNCLNLMEPESLSIVSEAYSALKEISNHSGIQMPNNKGDNRKLDCAIFKYIHQSRIDNKQEPIDTIRCAFSEGQLLYPNASFTSKGHIQVCVLNVNCIKGYFLPRPVQTYNPNL